MKNLVLLGLIACSLARQGKGDGDTCTTKTKCGECIPEAGCVWCSGRKDGAQTGVKVSTGLGMCITGTGIADCNRNPFGTLNTDGDARISSAVIKNGGVCPPSGVPSAFVNGVNTCTDCIAASHQWCAVENKDNFKIGGVCLDTALTPTCQTLATTLKGAVKGPYTTRCPICSDLPKCDGKGGCNNMGGCDWCYAKNGPTNVKLGYCATKEECGDGSEYGSLKAAVGTTFIGATAEADCPVSNDEPNPFVKPLRTCSTCIDEGFQWCKVESNTKVGGGVCLDKTKTWVKCGDLKNSLSLASAVAVENKADCPVCDTIDTCDGAGKCLANPHCSWCYAANAKGADTKLAFCTATGGCGDNSQFGSLKDATTITMRSVTTGQCPTRNDQPTSLVRNQPKCADCLTDVKNQWCKVVNQRGDTGGVCLEKSKSFVKCDDTLKTSLEVSSVTPIDDLTDCGPAPGGCDQKTSCGSCSAAGCDWCGVTTKDKDGKYYSGTQLGQCVQKGADCATGVFGSIKPALEYKLDKHEYKMKIKRFAVDKGWAQGDCKQTSIHKLAKSADCQKCIASKAVWCAVALKGINHTGGFCLGPNGQKAKDLCATFDRKEVKGQFYGATAEVKDKCSAGFMTSAGYGVLLAAVFAALAAF